GICIVLLYWNFFIRAGATSAVYLAFKFGTIYCNLLFLKCLAAVLAHCQLLAVLGELVRRTGGLVALRANLHHLAGTQRALALDDAAGLALAAGLGVALDHVHTFDNNHALLRVNGQNLAALALFLAGKNDCGVARLYMQCVHLLATSLQYFRCQRQDL